MVVRLVPVTRIRELDALRGFAVCGIMLVNTWQHAPHEPPQQPLDAVMEGTPLWFMDDGFHRMN
ncbi:hypothetical protein AB0K48_41750, partial [Nonomuraea sp. NPDC055795]